MICTMHCVILSSIPVKKQSKATIGPKTMRGGFKISCKGVHMYIGVDVRFADFISSFLNIQ